MPAKVLNPKQADILRHPALQSAASLLRRAPHHLGALVGTCSDPQLGLGGMTKCAVDRGLGFSATKLYIGCNHGVLYSSSGRAACSDFVGFV